MSILLNRRLHEFAAAEQLQKGKDVVERRTISILIELAERRHQKSKEEELKRAELSRKKELSGIWRVCNGE